MQVNINNIQRPALITPFLNYELNPDNTIVEYIETTSSTSNIVHKKSVTSNTNNIKKLLKEVYCRSIDNVLIKRCTFFRSLESSSLVFLNHLSFIEPDIREHKSYYKLYDNFSIFPQPHNGASSLV